MPTLTEYIEELKTELQAIAAPHKLQQQYAGLAWKEGQHQDAGVASYIVDFVIDRDYTLSITEAKLKLEPPEVRRQFDDYPNKALQAAWNVADILSTIVTYTPKENTIGLLRGLTTTGVEGNANRVNLDTSLTYLDQKTGAPFVIDETTYRINDALKRFIKNIKATENGPTLIAHTAKMGKSLDEMRLTIAQRLSVYDLLAKHTKPQESMQASGSDSDLSVKTTVTEDLSEDGSDNDDAPSTTSGL